MKKLLYVCFGNAYSWDGIREVFPSLVEYLSSNFDLKVLDYLKDSPNFDNKLDMLEKEVDIIVYDQTESSCDWSKNFPCTISSIDRKNKLVLTIGGKLDGNTFINELKQLL